MDETGHGRKFALQNLPRGGDKLQCPSYKKISKLSHRISFSSPLFHPLSFLSFFFFFFFFFSFFFNFFSIFFSFFLSFFLLFSTFFSFSMYSAFVYTCIFLQERLNIIRPTRTQVETFMKKHPPVLTEGIA